MTFDLCAIGDLVWSVSLKVDSFPIPGKTTVVHSVQRGIGNDASIVALLSAKMGLKTQLCSNAISNMDGYPLIQKLKDSEVNCDLIPTSASHTPTSFFLQEPSGQRTWLPENFQPTFVRQYQSIDTKFIYIDLYDGFLQARFNLLLELARKNKHRIFVNLSASSIDSKIVRLKKMNNIEIIQLSLPSAIGRAERFAQDIFNTLSYIEAVVVTSGEEGSVVCSNKGIFIKHCTNKAERSQITGAGAVFSAAFVNAVNEGYDYEISNEMAGEYATNFCLSQRNSLDL